MQLAMRQFDYNDRSHTYVAEASIFRDQLPVGKIPQNITLTDPEGRGVEFVFERPDVHHGEAAGYIYREVHSVNVPRKILLIND